MNFTELTTDALYEIEGGSILGDLVDEIPKAYDAIKSFGQGLVDGWNS